MAGLAIGAYQTSGSVGSYQTAAATDVVVTPGTGTLTTTLFAPTVVATANVTVTPATAALVTALFAPTVVATANVNVTPATAALVTALFAPSVATSSLGIITSGSWSSVVTFAAGDEFIVTLSGPAANAPTLRANLTFRRPST